MKPENDPQDGMTKATMGFRKFMQRDTPEKAHTDRCKNAYKIMTKGVGLRARQMGMIPR